MTIADLVIHARWVMPVEPEGVILDRHAVVVRDGRIVALLPSVEAQRQFQTRQSLELLNHALIPGFINAHTHAAMTLLRGLTDDVPLTSWRQHYIRPAEDRWLSAEFVRNGSELAMADMLRSGTTCFSDMYFFPEATAEVAQRAGLRACLGMIVVDFASAWADNPRDYLAKGTAIRDQYKDDPLLSFAFAPDAPSMLAGPWLKEIRMLADELDLPIHAHVHETAAEIAESLREHGKRPLARLADLGWVTSNLIAVHATQLTGDEIAELAHAGVQVVHCPGSNLKLASGHCPVAELMTAGVNVALGTDAAASNNALDMLAEMRCASLIAKAVSGDATAVPAATALRLATLNGARALGLEHDIGSLVPGKWADLTAVDLSVPECQPLYNPISQLVYCAGRQQVSDVWVAGRQLLRGGELTTLDLDSILERTAHWQQRIVGGIRKVASA